MALRILPSFRGVFRLFLSASAKAEATILPLRVRPAGGDLCFSPILFLPSTSGKIVIVPDPVALADHAAHSPRQRGSCLWLSSKPSLKALALDDHRAVRDDLSRPESHFGLSTVTIFFYFFFTVTVTIKIKI